MKKVFKENPTAFHNKAESTSLDVSFNILY